MSQRVIKDKTKIGNSESVNWGNYAKNYDMIYEFNPEYQKLLYKFEDFLNTLDFAGEFRVLDIGSGTGNYSAILSQRFPHCHIDVLEPNSEMLKIGKNKLKGHKNIQFFPVSYENFKGGEYDLIICTHVLYTMANTQSVLKSILSQLLPNGHLFLVDLGRVMHLQDWRSYLFKTLLLKYGLFKTLRIILSANEIAKQNSHIRNQQIIGNYWVHTHEECLHLLQSVGFSVVQHEIVFRGYSDLVVAKRLI